MTYYEIALTVCGVASGILYIFFAFRNQGRVNYDDIAGVILCVIGGAAVPSGIDLLFAVCFDPADLIDHYTNAQRQIVPNPDLFPHIGQIHRMEFIACGFALMIVGSLLVLDSIKKTFVSS